MKKYCKASLFALLTLLTLAMSGSGIAQQAPADRPPANVAGNWTFYTKSDENGRTDAHYLTIIQNGGTLSGHFKGTNQSGGIQGTVNLEHVVIKTKTRHVFTFQGRAQGNSIEGNCGIMGHHCTFQGVRTSGQQSSGVPD